MATTSATPATTAALTPSAAQQAAGSATASAPIAGPFLVASDGMPAAVPACRAASLLAARSDAEVCAIGVVEPLPTVGTDVSLPTLPPEVEAALKAELYDNVSLQVSVSSPPGHPWPIEILQGPPPLMIASRAREIGARAIVMGLGRHAVTDRLFGTETALQVLRLADVPVIAVPAGFAAAPRRAVMGVDFSAASVRAARLAVALFPDLIAIDLVHVAPPVGPAVVATPWESAYGTELAGAWPRFVASLDLPSSVLAQTFTLKGRPAEALLRHADSVGADLIVVGSHGRGFIGRLIVGSVATTVFRAAHTCVLGVPIVVSPATPGSHTAEIGHREAQ